MPEYLAPGVYVEEIDTGSKPIEGVSTSTAGMIGVTERGPVNVPILLTSFGDYTRWFGERLSFSRFPRPLLHAARGRGLLHQRRQASVSHAHSRYRRRNLRRRGVVRPRHADRRGYHDPPLGRRTQRYARPRTACCTRWTPRLSTQAIRSASATAAGRNTGWSPRLRHVTNNKHVPLSFPLSISHPAATSVEEFAAAPDAAYTGPFTLASPRARRHCHRNHRRRRRHRHSGGALPSLSKSEARQPASIAIPARHDAHDHHRARSTARGRTCGRASGSGSVRVLSLLGAPVQASALTPAAAAADRLIYVDDRNGNLDTQGDLVVLDRPNPDPSLREVRRIGLSRHCLSAPAPTHGTPLDRLSKQFRSATTTGSSRRSLASSMTLQNNAIDLLEPGTQLLVGSGAAQETVTVLSIAAPDTVNLTAAFANGHNPGDHVVPLFSMKTLAAAAPVGSIVLNLLNRVSLAVGDILRVGDAPDDEFVSVAAIPNRAAAGARSGQRDPFESAGPRASGRHERSQAKRGRDHSDPAHSAGPYRLARFYIGFSCPTVPASVANAVVRVTAGSGKLLPPPRSECSGRGICRRGAARSSPRSLRIPKARLLVERNPLLDVQALDAGSWGNRLRMSVEDERPGSVPRTAPRQRRRCRCTSVSIRPAASKRAPSWNC